MHTRRVSGGMRRDRTLRTRGRSFRCGCGRGEPSPGADVGAAQPDLKDPLEQFPVLRIHSLHLQSPRKPLHHERCACVCVRTHVREQVGTPAQGVLGILRSQRTSAVCSSSRNFSASTTCAAHRRKYSQYRRTPASTLRLQRPHLPQDCLLPRLAAATHRHRSGCRAPYV